MAMITTDNALYPEDFAGALDLVIDELSVARQASTLYRTNEQLVNFPLWTADPGTGWYGENTEISLTDGELAEITVVPKKVAGLTQISNEAIANSGGQISNLVGRGLARQIARSVDVAFFSDTTTNGPSGLESVDYTSVDADFLNTDSFVSAQYVAMANGANISHFLVAPDVAEALETAKVSDGSNQYLLSGPTVAGTPMLVSPHVEAGTVWGLDKSQVFVVVAKDTELKTSEYSAFSYDAVQVRAVQRVGFGFVNPSGIVKLAPAGSAS